MPTDKKIDRLSPDGRKTRATALEKEMLIKTVANWLLQGTHETNGLGHDLVTEVMKRAKVKSQRAYDIINEAWRRISEMGENEIKYTKGARVIVLEHQIKEIKENENIDATNKYIMIFKIHQEINKIHGVYAPSKTDITTKGEKIPDYNIPISSYINKLSLDELLKLAHGDSENEKKSQQRRNFDTKPN